jgi:hypothetical protein
MSEDANGAERADALFASCPWPDTKDHKNISPPPQTMCCRPLPWKHDFEMKKNHKKLKFFKKENKIDTDKDK